LKTGRSRPCNLLATLRPGVALRDLIVVGGGPAGLATALYAAGRGLDVTVFEPRQAPIDKACGEGVMPPGVAALADLGVSPAGLPFRGIRYLDESVSVDGLFGGVSGLGVRRTTLHASLTDAVARAGISCEATQVRSFIQDASGVVVNGLRAKWLVGADGLHSRIRRLAGMAAGSAGQQHRYGLRRHFALAPWTDLVEVYWAGDCEAYVTPVAPDCVGIAFLLAGGDREGRAATGDGTTSAYGRRLRMFPALLERLGDAAPSSEVRGAGPLRQRVHSRVTGRVVLVGDAAGYIDPLTGEGIGLSLTCARAAVDCLVRGRAQDYERAWRRLTRQHRVMTSALLWCAERPALRSRLVPLAARLPRVFTVAVNRLAA
jgi:flavin-dependent dehydrogenase